MAVYDDMNGLGKPHLLGMIAGLFLAGGLVLSACVATTAWFQVKTTPPPEFIYTRAGEVKVETLSEAARDARSRAEQIATQGGRGIGGLQTADMGVIQRVPIYSGQTSWEGMHDTSSLDKTITAVVTATFALK